MIAQEPPNIYLSLLAGLPETPKKWDKEYRSSIIARCNQRIESLEDKAGDVRQARIAPRIEQITIGSAVQAQASILFLDICGFSSWPNSNHSEQKTVLKVMNVFMSEMYNIVRDFDGAFEKNTGDGMMAHFGSEAKTQEERVKPAVEAAVVMHYVNDELISPWLTQNGFNAVKFRVGIDTGPVTIAKVGIAGGMNSLVAIGSPANVACKIMNLIPLGGICIGTHVYNSLPRNWNRFCSIILKPTGFIYVMTKQPYTAWQLSFRLSTPVF